jgi:hypothetical protein
LNAILPQVSTFLSSSDFQSFKDKIIQTVLSQVGQKIDVNTLQDKLRPVLQQYLGSKAQVRFDIDTLLQQIAGAAASALPGIVLSLLGKRDLPANDARSLDQILSLVDQYQLNTIIPHIETYLGPDKLQALQNQFFGTVVTALGNNWNMNTVAQALQQVVTQYVPQAASMRIE